MSEDPHTVMHVYEGDGGVIIRDGGNISTFGVQSRAVMAAFEAASDEPGPEHHVIADLAARLAKAERALEEANDWRPMESAPRDGTEILAAIEVHNTTGRKWWERHVISFDECRNEIGLDYDHGWSWEDYIRWRPLPSPPKEG